MHLTAAGVYVLHGSWPQQGSLWCNSIDVKMLQRNQTQIRSLQALEARTKDEYVVMQMMADFFQETADSVFGVPAAHLLEIGLPYSLQHN